APVTSAFAEHDGTITGVTGESITDNVFNYGLDYLGYQLKRAAEKWFDTYHQPLSNVHIIAHSMGGVLSRAYMQSTAYGDTFHSDVAEGNLPVPVVSNFSMLGVPHQGGIGPWNGWNDNFVADASYRLVLSKVIAHAWKKLEGKPLLPGAEIVYASGFGDTIRKSDFDGMSEQDAKIRFVRRYMPGLANLLPSFAGFADNFDPFPLTELRNPLLMDLNTDRLFADRVARSIALYGASVNTPALVKRQVGGFLPDVGVLLPAFGSSLLSADEILSFTDYIARDPHWGEVYYEDIKLDAHGDGTVAIESLERLFTDDNRVELFPFCNGTCRPGDRATTGKVSHTMLPSNIEAQGMILTAMHHTLLPSLIKNGAIPENVIGSIQEDIGTHFSNIGIAAESAGFDFFTIFVDPVDDAFLVDEQGNRTGFSSTTGHVADIPNSYYLGETDGVGWIFGDVDETMTLELIGNGSEHYVQVAAFDDGKFFGVESEGFLAPGETRSIPIVPPGDQPLSVQLLAPYNGDGVVEGTTFDVFAATFGDVVVDHVDFHVDDQLVDTLAAEPFEFQFTVPADAADVRVRVVAVDEQLEEATAESTLLVYEPSFMTIDSLVVGSGAGDSPVVSVFDPDGTKRFSFFAFDPEFQGGVRVATGDVNNDGTPDIITSVGAGVFPYVRVVNGIDGTSIHHIAAFDASYTGGVYVASGDVNGDGFDDIITGAGGGETLPVKVFDGQTGDEIRSFFAYEASLNGGVFVASGDVNGDGNDDIITGAGAGNSSVVKVFDGVDGEQLQSFFAYDPSFTGGVHVAAADVNGDGLANIITAPAAGGGPHVKVFDAGSNQIDSFFAYDLGFRGGINVAASDVNDDGFDDIMTTPGGSGPQPLKIFDRAGDSVIENFFPYGTDFTGGVFAAGSLQSHISVVNLPASGGVFDAFVDNLDVVVKEQGGVELFRGPQVDHVRLRINGTTNVDDVLIVNVDGLFTKLSFDGQDGGNDSLQLLGSLQLPLVKYQFLNEFDGIISGSSVGLQSDMISFFGFEPITDMLPVDNRVFTFTGAGDDILLTTGLDANDTILRIESDHSELVDFIQPSGSLTVEFGDGDDNLTVDLDQLPRLAGGDGRNTLVVAGAGGLLDLTQIDDGDVQGIDRIDIDGSGDNTLTLDKDEVLNISPNTGTLQIVHGVGDVVNYGDGWSVQAPQIIQSLFHHIATQDAAEIQVINTTPFLNPWESRDVDRDGAIMPLDALIIINRINGLGGGPLQTPLAAADLVDFFYYDVDGDGELAPIDVLLIVNFLNRPAGLGEAEMVAARGAIGAVNTSEEPLSVAIHDTVIREAPHLDRFQLAEWSTGKKLTGKELLLNDKRRTQAADVT
ncbi:MAG: hypothetical protein ACI9HK_005385, partial [Pirellulaceae bacterium]